MDIQDIQKKREELKDDIYGLIIKFERETNVGVHSVDLRRDSIFQIGDNSSRTLLSNINIDIRM